MEKGLREMFLLMSNEASIGDLIRSDRQVIRGYVPVLEHGYEMKLHDSVRMYISIWKADQSQLQST